LDDSRSGRIVQGLLMEDHMKPATLLYVTLSSIALLAYWLTSDGPATPEPLDAANANQDHADSGKQIAAEASSNRLTEAVNPVASARRKEAPDATKKAFRSDHEVADPPVEAFDASPLTLAQISQVDEAHALLLEQYAQRIDQIIGFDSDQEVNSKAKVLESAYSFIAGQNSLAVDLYKQYAQSPTSLTLVAGALAPLSP
jgi:hypothetical protein